MIATSERLIPSALARRLNTARLPVPSRLHAKKTAMLLSSRTIAFGGPIAYGRGAEGRSQRRPPIRNPFIPAVIAAFAIGALGANLAIPAAHANIRNAPTTWNGLVLVNEKAMDAVYLLPHADFRVYSKVMLDPAEVAFAKNWLRDYNRSTISLQSRISDTEARDMLDRGAARANEIFAKAFAKAGYQLVTTPGPDVVEITPMIVNVRVTAPASMEPGQATFSRDAGEATLALQAKDSITHQALGLALDHQIAGDYGNIPMMRSDATNLGEFEDVVADWAKRAAGGFGKLKQMSPIDTDGQRRG